MNLALFNHDYSRHDYDLNLGKFPLDFEMKLEISEKYSAFGCKSVHIIVSKNFRESRFKNSEIQNFLNLNIVS